jgi:hypothetical protein
MRRQPGARRFTKFGEPVVHSLLSLHCLIGADPVAQNCGSEYKQSYARDQGYDKYGKTSFHFSNAT